MPHADTSLIPQTITTKAEFWRHVHLQLGYLFKGQRHWITNLANASSLIYHSLLAFPTHFGSGERAVNWCGFYLISSLFPPPRLTVGTTGSEVGTLQNETELLLGPFCGKPACQFIRVESQGVCADAFVRGKTILVQNVHSYPGHIACDGATNSEIVCPLIYHGRDGKPWVIGVLDLDCLTQSGFDQDDQDGLEKVAQLIVSSCDW